MLALSLLLDGPAAVGDAFATIGWPTIASVAYTAGLASLVGYTIWNMLLGRYPAALVAPFALLTPPVGLAAAALLLGQVPNPLELAGSAVLVGGVAVGQLRRRARDPVAAPRGTAAAQRAPLRSGDDASTLERAHLQHGDRRGTRPLRLLGPETRGSAARSTSRPPAARCWP